MRAEVRGQRPCRRVGAQHAPKPVRPEAARPTLALRTLLGTRRAPSVPCPPRCVLQKWRLPRELAPSRGQLSPQEVGEGQGKAFVEQSGLDEPWQEHVQRKGRAPPASRPHGGMSGSFSSQPARREKGSCCQLALARAGRDLTAACRAPSTHSSGSSQRFKSLAFLA